MKLKNLINRIRKMNQTEREASEERLNKLRQKGAKIGEDVYVYASNATIIDETTPWLLTIGDHVRITSGVKILTHDFSWSVVKKYGTQTAQPGQILGSQRPVEIGDCVFIGMNAVITCGSKIGHHVIIGAGSVVSGVCESNSVYAGVPARRIMSMDEYYEKRKSRQLQEAREFVRLYRERLGAVPPVEAMTEYFPLFMTAEKAMQIPVLRRQMAQMDNLDETIAAMQTPAFDSYDAFIQFCLAEENSTEM